MTGRKVIGLAVCALALGCFSNLSSAHAQGQSPFTIRRPSDGATVREKQHIEIPGGSIKPGGFVAFYLDGKFYLALAPEEEEGGADKPFTFIWDTKGTGVTDGEHTLRAVLYEPAGNTSGVAVTEAGHSEVRLTVANKIKDGPESLLLRYRFKEGDDLVYARNGKAIVVSAGSQNNKFNDEELSSVKSTLQLAVEDVRFDSESQANKALVRNKLTSLSILDGNQERILDRSQLSSSMYQELLTNGKVIYETGEKSGSEFTALGLPINNTLELPLLPTLRISVGQAPWKTENQRLDIPGLSPADQPKVSLTNEFVGLEYEGGYKTAKIHQSFSGAVTLPKGAKTLQFGPVEVMSPRVEFERDIYVAYEANLLIKTTRKLTVKGTTTSPIGAPPDNGVVGGGGGSRFGGGGSPFSGGAPGGGSSPYGGVPGFSGGPASAGAGAGLGGPGGYPGAGGPGARRSGGSGGYPGGYPGAGGQGARQGGPGGYPGSGGPGSRQSGGYSGYPGAGGARQSGGPASAGAGVTGGQGGGTQFSGYPGNPNSGGGGNFAGSGGGSQTDVPHAISLRSITDTYIMPEKSSIAAADEGPKSHVKTISKPAAKHGTTHRRSKGH